MRWNVLLREIRISLSTHLLRSLLATIGIVVGVCAVFLTFNITHYIHSVLERELSPISRMIIVLPQAFSVKGVNIYARKASRLTEKDSQNINKLNFVSSSAPILTEKMQVLSQFSNLNTTVLGTTSNYFKVLDLNLVEGVGFSSSDLGATRRVAVIGRTIQQKLFKNAPALGQTISLNNVAFKVIGIIETQGQSVDGVDRDNLVVIPISTLRQSFFDDFSLKDAVDYILVAIKNPSFMDLNIAAISDLLYREHNIQKNKIDFKILNRVKEVESIQFIFLSISKTLMIMGLLSLLVSGIGISTLMLMSISERKSEIGLRKAIGASDKEIILQILLEAVCLSLLGGILGSLGGIVALYLFNYVMGLNLVPSYLYLLFCWFIAMTVGVVSGLFPAYQTLKIQPTTALNEHR
ncbi:ABC transporter permease [Legionella hackeliae]|uniref:Uncharacterized protein n=1 Tax=Legionella hackeliae TaxID=449 RepID=A0A0A8UP28_LEGHA|nr:ABC transporter permease [Legionella hackeliae]KTD13430.1 ABC transporter permease [Legionella hackeliae]CEK09271.1 membrane protein of unknown function [Legionella hackeliae]STX49177.1 ABC transporter permease [Legionella hackeliae]